MRMSNTGQIARPQINPNRNVQNQISPTTSTPEQSQDKGGKSRSSGELNCCSSETARVVSDPPAAPSANRPGIHFDWKLRAGE